MHIFKKSSPQRMYVVSSECNIIRWKNQGGKSKTPHKGVIKSLLCLKVLKIHIFTSKGFIKRAGCHYAVYGAVLKHPWGFRSGWWWAGCAFCPLSRSIPCLMFLSFVAYASLSLWLQPLALSHTLSVPLRLNLLNMHDASISELCL